MKTQAFGVSSPLNNQENLAQQAGTCLATWKGHGRPFVKALAVLNNGWIISGDSNGIITCWQVNEEGAATCLATWEKIPGDVRTLAVANKWVVSGSGAFNRIGKAMGWQVNEDGTATCLSAWGSTGGNIDALVVTADGRVITGSNANGGVASIGISQVCEGKYTATPIHCKPKGAHLPRNSHNIQALAVLADGRIISGASTGYQKSGEIRCWQVHETVSNKKYGKKVQEVHEWGITCLATWEGYRLKLMSDLPSGDKNKAEEKVIYLSEERRVCLLRGLDKKIYELKLPNNISLADLKTRLNTSDLEKSILSFTSQGGYTPQKWHTSGVTALVNLGNDLVVSGSGQYNRPGEIKCWQVHKDGTATCLATWEEHTSSITALANMGNDRVVSGSTKEIKCWQVHKNGTATCLATWEENVAALVILADGRIVSAGSKGIKCWQGLKVQQQSQKLPPYFSITNSYTPTPHPSHPSSTTTFSPLSIEHGIVTGHETEKQRVCNTPQNQPLASSSSSGQSATPTIRGLWADHEIDTREIQLIRELARGGFGQVWLGHWHGSDVAIKKLLSLSMDQAIREEFKEEAKIMMTLKHPNIVQFYGVVFVPEQMIVLEFMAEGALFDVLHSNKPLSWKLRYNIGVDMARGIVYLHGRRLMHRDLKSLNVLLDVNFKAKLGDFGLAALKEVTGQTETVGAFPKPVGTVRWMAPELFMPHGKYTYACDVYAMAIVLWELMSREIPYKQFDDNYVIPGHVLAGNRDAIPPQTPQIMRSVTASCWAQKPEDRLTAKEALNQLQSQPVVDDVPIPSPHA